MADMLIRYVSLSKVQLIFLFDWSHVTQVTTCVQFSVLHPFTHCICKEQREHQCYFNCKLIAIGMLNYLLVHNLPLFIEIL